MAGLTEMDWEGSSRSLPEAQSEETQFQSFNAHIARLLMENADLKRSIAVSEARNSDLTRQNVKLKEENVCLKIECDEIRAHYKDEAKQELLGEIEKVHMRYKLYGRALKKIHQKYLDETVERDESMQNQILAQINKSQAEIEGRISAKSQKIEDLVDSLMKRIDRLQKNTEKVRKVEKSEKHDAKAFKTAVTALISDMCTVQGLPPINQTILEEILSSTSRKQSFLREFRHKM